MTMSLGFEAGLGYETLMGFFITLEGGEGGGKSTQTELLSRALESKGQAVLSTREPGGTGLGKKVREILLSEKNHGILPETELLLYAADRAQHVGEVLRPALAENKIIVCDRFQDSSTIYQGMGRGLNLKWIEMLSEMATGGLKPDLTFILDLDPELGLKRSHERLATEKISEGRFEKEDLGFHQRIREGFLNLARREPARFVVIRADRAAMEVHEEILKETMSRIPKK